MINNEISDITFYTNPNGEVFPEEDINTNERKLKGFIWRLNEKPKNKNDLFSKNDKELIFPEIKEIEIPDSFFSKFNFNK